MRQYDTGDCPGEGLKRYQDSSNNSKVQEELHAIEKPPYPFQGQTA
jgi:hypothetical protein